MGRGEVPGAGTGSCGSPLVLLLRIGHSGFGNFTNQYCLRPFASAKVCRRGKAADPHDLIAAQDYRPQLPIRLGNVTLLQQLLYFPGRLCMCRPETVSRTPVSHCQLFGQQRKIVEVARVTSPSRSSRFQFNGFESRSDLRNVYPARYNEPIFVIVGSIMSLLIGSLEDERITLAQCVPALRECHLLAFAFFF